MISISDLKTIWDFIRDSVGWLSGNGIVAEFMEPDWFSFGGGSYRIFTPQAVDLWLKVYFRNTSKVPMILQSVKGEFLDSELPWQGGYYDVQPRLHGEGYVMDLPKTVQPEDSLLLYFRFHFSVNHWTPTKFIKEIKKLPTNFVLKISYSTKEKGKTKTKVLNGKMNLRVEYAKIYHGFLNSYYSGQIVNTEDQNYQLCQRLLKETEHILYE